MSTPVQPPTGGKGPGGKLAAAAGGRRNLFIAAAAGTALLAFVMARSGGGGGAADGGSDQIMLGYDSGPYDQYNDLQQRIEDLNDRLDDQEPGVVTPKPPGPPTTLPAAPKPPAPPLTPKPPVKPLPSTKPVAKYVTIKKGDTLSGIAKRSGLSMATLKKLNPTFWTNPKYKSGNMIWAGGKVRVK